MDLETFYYDLDEELIAQEPYPRGKERLLVADRSASSIFHRGFVDFISYLRPGDVMVMNDSRVIPARLWGRKQTGGRVEVMLLKETGPARWECLVRASKSPGPGTRLGFGDGLDAVVEARQANRFVLKFSSGEKLLEKGEIPLPPYIKRMPREADIDAYQTVYARYDGSVAAPTAGLHFTPEYLHRLEKYGIELACITLHVGDGTFVPVRTEKIEDHQMHSEAFNVSDDAAQIINRAMQEKRRVIAVGTTTTRVLEYLMRTNREIVPGKGSTDIFIYPPGRFMCIDGLLTNLHLPCSTLLMLTCAFGGYDLVMKAYSEAVKRRYRFFSYGDAMFIL
ncbi:MAG: tRNA preQ1(34) S-adenosylmethionine ribosyltransferase-isomerase QueA [Thermodesulfobacteriota bacterium]|nr:tRNA preQ1(34) S-adenosylmethionine ribosyltransferase-isomerase QueA [Thermodesulfobacteriota bacterium]